MSPDDPRSPGPLDPSFRPGLDPCAGPNHGNSEALPRGPRTWANGNCISLTQRIEDISSQMTFCSPDCMCDWHGAAVAYERDCIEGGFPDFEVPGSFTLVWIVPNSTTIGRFPDFAALTAKIGDYQRRALERLDAREAGDKADGTD